jgi:hypothetical protein
MTYQLKNLNVASLDFSEIKSSLTTFFNNQPELQDIDFTNNASTANLILNILSTVTAYNGIYAQYGYVNSFATTTTLLPSILGIAANNSVLIAPSQSATCTRTVTAAGATLYPYTSFKAKTTTGADTFFFNIDTVNSGVSKSLKLYSGSEVVSYTNYNYDTQSCELPYTVDPDTISFYENVNGGSTYSEWTRVDKSSTGIVGNNKTFTVINGPKGFIVTNNFVSALEIQTSNSVLIKAVTSNGTSGNNAAITARSDVTFVTNATPSGGYSQISVTEARCRLLFKATGQDRCVTINDFVNAILSSGISGTSDSSLITVATDCCVPGTVNIYVTGLSSNNQSLLLSYLNARSVAGINLVYRL